MLPGSEAGWNFYSVKRGWTKSPTWNRFRHWDFGQCEKALSTRPLVMMPLKSWAQFLLKQQNLLKQKHPCLVKSEYRPRLNSIVMLSKQQINTSHKQYIWHDIWPVTCVKLFSCLSKLFCLSSSMKLAPGHMYPYHSRTSQSLAIFQVKIFEDLLNNCSLYLNFSTSTSA